MATVNIPERMETAGNGMRMGQLQQRNVSFMFGRDVFDCMPNLLVGWWEIVSSRICVCMSGGVCVAWAFVFVRAH